MNRIDLLDCTLRDGGYVNNWRFGANAIAQLKTGLEKAGIDIIELGFLRNVARDPDRTAFSTIEDINQLLGRKNPQTIYSAMIEAFDPYPLEKLVTRDPEGVDLLRICIWKRLMGEHMQYCKAVSEKGYRITIQPSRVEQYNREEFIDMLKRANDLHAYAVYVVDTWGTQSSTQICRYLEVADRYLDQDIKIGYHGHNNKMQALSCAQAALNMELSRDICIDASVMGMGRGAGNLHTEVIMDYLNERHDKCYDINQAVSLFNEYLRPTYEANPWGYSMYYFLSAMYGCNPNYATYFQERQYGVTKFRCFLSHLTEQEKIVFNANFVEERLRTLAISSFPLG